MAPTADATVEPTSNATVTPTSNSTLAPTNVTTTKAPEKKEGSAFLAVGVIGGLAFTVGVMYWAIKFFKPVEEESSAVSNVEDGRKNRN